MTTQQVILSIVSVALIVSVAGGDTGFTYQGRLVDAGQPANGTFNVDFFLWDDPVAGVQIGPTNTFDSLPIAEGLFTVELDFGATAFDNSDRWLEISVDGVPLVPRQPITRSPYAIQTRGIFVDDVSNVGIGTTDPLALLHVGEGYTPTVGGITAQIAGGIAAQQDVVSDGGNILSRSPPGANAAVMSLDASADPGGTAWSLISNADNSPYGAPDGSLIIYNTQSGKQAIRAESDGSVEIGTGDSDSGMLYVETSDKNVAISGANTFGKWGGHFRSFDINGIGVQGVAHGEGASCGVFGTTLSGTGGVGVYGFANVDGLNYGIYGYTYSDIGYAGYFEGGRNYFEGDVGIGTEDPTERLHITGGADNNGSTASLRVTTGSASILMDGNEIDTVNSALYLNHNNPNDVYMGTAGGNVGIGTSSPSAALHVEGPAAVDALRVRVGGTTRLMVSDTGGVSGGVVVGGNTNPQYMLHLTTGSAGKPGGGLWAATSDRRLKKNVQKLDGALQRLLELRGVTFQYKDPESINENPGEHIGLIAQEVQPVFPDWVQQAPDGYLRVSEKGLTALTVEALRELREEKDKQIEQLRLANERDLATQRREMDSLRAKNEEFQQRFARLESLVLQLQAENK